jgi:hypothetical protein
VAAHQAHLHQAAVAVPLVAALHQAVKGHQAVRVAATHPIVVADIKALHPIVAVRAVHQQAKAIRVAQSQIPTV